MDADILGSLIGKFLDYRINLSPQPLLDSAGAVRLAGLDNHAMGTIFEELIRRFNEENNEEAGEHFTPRDVVTLMAELIFQPIAHAIKDGTYTVYDGACGTGGMLTVAEDRLKSLAAEGGKRVSVHLFGQEVQPETYAITKADLLLKGEGEEAENFVYGSTLSADGFTGHEFDFMLSNPPYGKSWKTDLEKMGGKAALLDPRFVVAHAGVPDLSLITRSSDGQLMFLVSKLAKMKRATELGSRIAEVHNGSSLFTGDAGQGESNIRRWILESDWLEAIIALPLNMFYNTGIATYIWVLTNRKPVHRRGMTQLIDATTWFKPLRKNLGKKNCELSPQDMARVIACFMAFEETAYSRVLPNAAFGYWKVTVERPLRLPGIEPHRAYSPREIKELRAARQGNATAQTDADAPAVIRKIHRANTVQADSLHGLFAATIGGKPCVVEYEPDPDLRDTENVPLLQEGGVAAFIAREVWPHVPDAWVQEDKTQVGYEISFTRYFYKPKAMRTLDEIRRDIEALEKETEGLLGEVLVDAVGVP